MGNFLDDLSVFEETELDLLKIEIKKLKRENSILKDNILDMKNNTYYLTEEITNLINFFSTIKDVTIIDNCI